MKEEKKHPNTRSALMRSGCLAAFYTLNGYFLKVKPAFGIDKVMFSFVQKGSQGQGFDVYMDIDRFDNLCDMILSRELDRKLDGSSQQNPAYSYVTGQNGAKQLSIFAGKAGVVIHGWYAEKKLNANVPVQTDELRTMAKWFRRICGKYYEELTGYCLEAMNGNARFFEQNQDEPSEEPVVSEDKPQAQDSPNQQNQQPKTSKSEKKTEKPAAKGKKLIKTLTPLTPLGNSGNLCFKAIDGKNREEVFVVCKDYISTFNSAVWADFNSRTGDPGIFVTVAYVPHGDRMLITDFVKIGR